MRRPRSRSSFGASVPLYAAQIARALIPEASVLLVDARPQVRELAGRLGLEACPPKALRRRQAPLVVDSSGDPRGLAAALHATAPDGICSCAGNLHVRRGVGAAGPVADNKGARRRGAWICFQDTGQRAAMCRRNP